MITFTSPRPRTSLTANRAGRAARPPLRSACASFVRHVARDINVRQGYSADPRILGICPREPKWDGLGRIYFHVVVAFPLPRRKRTHWCRAKGSWVWISSERTLGPTSRHQWYCCSRIFTAPSTSLSRSAARWPVGHCTNSAARQTSESASLREADPCVFNAVRKLFDARSNGVSR
jgi:hypothetical protein